MQLPSVGLHLKHSFRKYSRASSNVCRRNIGKNGWLPHPAIGQKWLLHHPLCTPVSEGALFPRMEWFSWLVLLVCMFDPEPYLCSLISKSFLIDAMEHVPLLIYFAHCKIARGLPFRGRFPSRTRLSLKKHLGYISLSILCPCKIIPNHRMYMKR